MKNRLKEKRKARGLTQLQVAKTLGILVTSYQNIEYGKRVPSLSTALRLAKIYGVAVEDLFEELPIVGDDSFAVDSI